MKKSATKRIQPFGLPQQGPGGLARALASAFVSLLSMTFTSYTIR